MASRRRFLAVLSATTTAVAGCATRADVPPEPGSTQSTDPDKHVYEADGEWSSFGCNASNTRTVADGKAPVDGVSEKWRVEVPQTTYQEPLVTDGRVFVTTPSMFVVYDAADGTELWRKDDESGADVRATPLVRDGITTHASATDCSHWMQRLARRSGNGRSGRQGSSEPHR
ncbi:outer membrane protein assembly factor BamB family protein [Haladaptatus sp. NG-WS-4]